MVYVEVLCLGDVEMLTFLKVDHISTAEKEVSVKEYYTSGGGIAASVAVGLSRLDVASGLVASLGNDVYGKMLKEMLEKEGVDLTCVKTVDLPTGQRIVIADKRGIKWSLKITGANEEWSPDMVSEEYLKVIRAVYLTGDTLIGKRKSIALRIARKAKELEKSVFLELSSKILGEESGILSGLRSLADYWIMTEDQAIELLGTLSNSALRYFLKRMESKGILIKSGLEGTHVFAKNVSTRIPLQVSKVVDLVGLDEAYTVGFIYGILSGYDIVASARIANAVAAYKIAGRGPWHLPTAAELSEVV